MNKKVRTKLLEDLAKLDTNERGFQSQVIDTIEKACFPFDWATFLRRRISRTYDVDRGILEGSLNYAKC